MNKYQLYTLGGALLAATSLSGTASAGTVGVVGQGGTVITASPLKLSNLAISPTAATANAQTITLGGTKNALALGFVNTYDPNFNLDVTIPISGGALFSGTPTVHFLIRGNSGTGSYAATATAATLNVGTPPTISSLSNTVFISGAQVSLGTGTLGAAVSPGTQSIGGILLSPISFTNLSSLSTVGGSISLGATVASHTNASLVYETVGAGAVVTSAAPVVSVVNALSAASVSATASPQFTTFTGGSTSVILASISITGTGTVGSDLSAPIDADGGTSGLAAGATAAAGSLNVTLTSAALSDANASSISVVSKTSGKVQIAANTLTKSSFGLGSITFSLAAGSQTYDGTTYVQLAYNGTTAISAAAAGTVSAALVVGGSSYGTPPTANGATAAISFGANLSTQLDWVNNGGSQFVSYIRIHNTGASAGAGTVVVKRDTTDGSAIVTVGTYTTSTVPAGGTIQVAMGTIESALAATAAGSYTLTITAPFSGYVQHISYNGTSGSLSDLSGFRSGGGTTP
jgi:hypothetical protein